MTTGPDTTARPARQQVRRLAHAHGDGRNDSESAATIGRRYRTDRSARCYDDGDDDGVRFAGAVHEWSVLT